jgi:deazaflavin-dependent oxidoreductase (nitroreductase family)
VTSLGLRLLKHLGESRFWKRTGHLHAWLYRTTGGRVGSRAGGQQHLLLTATGRRSGTSRTVPLTFMPDGPRWILVASNGGADRHPAWWLNLRREPQATVQVGAETIPVRAHEANGDERARLWPLLKEMNPFYAAYERITSRTIPVVVLEADVTRSRR